MSADPHRTDMTAMREQAPLVDAVASSSAPVVTATNVVPFTRVRRETIDAAPALTFDPSSRPVPYWPPREQLALIAGLLAVSLLAHGALYVLFNRPPEPMVSIGLEAISVELVPGADTQAGLATTTGPNDTQAAPADDPEPNPTDIDTADPDPPKPVQAAEAAPPDVTEAKPEETTDPSPEPQVAALEPAREPEPVAPEVPKTVAEPPPEPKPVQRETRPKPERDAKPRPQRAETGRGPPAASRTPPGRAPSRRVASASAGRRATRTIPGSFGHLERYQRQAHTEPGRAIVTFRLDGGGRVTSVSLSRSSGVASLDQEAQAAVRRASPFPAPPNGRGTSFTVPVSFSFRRAGS